MDFTALIREVTAKFEQNLSDVVSELRENELTPAAMQKLVVGLKCAVNQAGLSALVGIVTQHDERSDVMVRKGRRFRFKKSSEKEWLTAFGIAKVERRHFQRDDGGIGVFPIDERCGMVERFMTPDIEELVALASSNLVPKEVEALLGKALPHGPSATAVQRVIRDVGGFAEDHEEELDSFIHAEKPLTDEGDVCVISWDGVNVPLREKAPKRGRPTERPGVREAEESPTAWKEAGVSSISIYSSPDDPDLKPKRLDKRYFARMPEAGMKRLLQQQEDAVRDLVASRKEPFREMVVLCDGKRTIWNVADNTELYGNAIQILDFHHAMGHLSRASEVLFGKKNAQGADWYDRYRVKMLEETGGTPSAIRSMRYYRKRLRRGSDRFTVVSRVIAFFGKNIERMRYAEFAACGLPIGSGPVEAACKTIVGARIKRSGMRWTREGGQLVLNLRRHEKANRWDSFWRFYLDRLNRDAA